MAEALNSTKLCSLSISRRYGFRVINVGRSYPYRRCPLGNRRNYLKNQSGHLSNLLPELVVVHSHLRQIAAGIMLLPELGGQGFAEVSKSFEARVHRNGSIEQSRKVVDSLEGPALPDQVAFEVAFGRCPQ